MVLPYLKAMSNLPQNAPRPALPAIPDCLSWQERVDEWGLLDPGTWLDQPKWFMEDLRAAKTGKRRWQNEQVEHTRLSADMPKVSPTVAR